MDNTYVNISDVVESAKEYKDYEVTYGDKTIIIGIRSAIDISEAMELAIGIREASKDEDGNLDWFLFWTALALGGMKYYTNIDPDTSDNDLLLLWQHSDLENVLCHNTSFDRMGDAYYSNDDQSEKEKFFGRLNKFIDSIEGNLPEMDEKTQKDLIDNIANANWGEIVDKVVGEHKDEWDRKNEGEPIPKLSEVTE